MLNSEQIKTTLHFLKEIFVGCDPSYTLDFSEEDDSLQEQFFIYLSDKVVIDTIHLKVLNQLQKLWQCEDIQVRFTPELLYLCPYLSKENLQ